MQDSLADFLAAVQQNDDEAAECAALGLTPADQPALVALSSSPDVEQRWWAVRGLAVVGDRQAVDALRARLGDADAGVRAAAALAFAHLHARQPDAVTPWLGEVAALLADDDGMVRQTAADCLSQCGDDGVPALGRVLRESTHEGARTRAASALRKIATMRAAAILYALLNDDNHLVRSYAYEGLDEMGLLENVLVVPL